MRFRYFCQKQAYALKVFFAIAFTGAVLTFCFAVSRTPLSALRGEREYYLRSASSQAEIKTETSLSNLLILRGESVFLSCINETEAQKKAEELLSSFRAEIKKTERVGDTTSYYCYSPTLGAGMRLTDKTVNLHIAVRENRVAIGSPIVFGGY